MRIKNYYRFGSRVDDGLSPSDLIFVSIRGLQHLLIGLVELPGAFLEHSLGLCRAKRSRSRQRVSSAISDVTPNAELPSAALPQSTRAY